MPLTRRRSTRIAAASALALAGGLLLLPGGADAQTEPTFSITPTTVAVGEPITLTATGCVAENVPQDQLFVVVAIDGVDNQAGALLTDETGTATTTLTAEESDAGTTATFGAACVQGTGETATIVFEYPNTIDVTVTAATTPTTPGTTPPAAPPAAAAPAFTG